MKSTTLPSVEVKVPSIQLDAGTEFGHTVLDGFVEVPRVLVRVPLEIGITQGLHLFVAPNGSGKTTFMRTIAGLHPLLNGQHRTVGRVHYIADQLQVDGELKAKTLFKVWFAGKAEQFAFELAVRLRLDVGCEIQKLSRGNRQKVLLILGETMAAFSKPSLLLLDEPLTGLDMETREIVADLWANDREVLRFVVLHELESIQRADSLFTVVGGELRHTTQKVGGSWLETCRELRSSI